MTKSKTALIAAFVLGSVSAALAQSSGEEIQNSAYQLNPNAAVPVYAQSADRQPNLIEGRNVSVRNQAVQVQQDNADRLESFGGY
jgi:hypothetical protein